MASLSRRRSGIYELRRRVPADLQAVIGKKEIRVSLGTRDLRKAKLARLAKEAEIERLFAAARNPPARLSNEHIHALRARWLAAKVAEHEADPPAEAAIDGGLDALEAAEERGKAAEVVSEEVDALLAEVGLHNVAPESRRELAERIFWALVEFHQTMTRRLHGDYSPPPSLANAPVWRSAPAQGRSDSPSQGSRAVHSLDALFTLWQDDRPSRSPQTVATFKGHWKDFTATAGTKGPLEITKADAWAWANALKARGLHPKTINGGYLGTVSAVFSVAVRHDWVPSNPFRGVKVASDWVREVREARKPFDDEDARRLLAAARARGGWVHWVTLVMAYTGARLEEVCGARAGDVRQAEGVWVLDINVDAKGRALKNRASVRRVPLHPAVVAAGFTEYARALPQQGPLFPALNPGKSGRRSAVASKRLARLLRKDVGILDPCKVAAHSWRHRLKTLLRAAGVPEDANDALTGHAPRHEGGRYGEFPLATLAEYVAKLPEQG
jgi:integrase